jgi:hypothetical protein
MDVSGQLRALLRPAIEPQFLGGPAKSPSLYRLSYVGSFVT